MPPLYGRSGRCVTGLRPRGSSWCSARGRPGAMATPPRCAAGAYVLFLRWSLREAGGRLGRGCGHDRAGRRDAEGPHGQAARARLSMVHRPVATPFSGSWPATRSVAPPITRHEPAERMYPPRTSMSAESLRTRPLGESNGMLTGVFGAVGACRSGRSRCPRADAARDNRSPDHVATRSADSGSEQPTQVDYSRDAVGPKSMCPWVTTGESVGFRAWSSGAGQHLPAHGEGPDPTLCALVLPQAGP